MRPSRPDIHHPGQHASHGVAHRRSSRHGAWSSCLPGRPWSTGPAEDSRSIASSPGRSRARGCDDSVRRRGSRAPPSRQAGRLGAHTVVRRREATGWRVVRELTLQEAPPGIGRRTGVDPTQSSSTSATGTIANADPGCARPVASGRARAQASRRWPSGASTAPPRHIRARARRSGPTGPDEVDAVNRRSLRPVARRVRHADAVAAALLGRITALEQALVEAHGRSNRLSSRHTGQPATTRPRPPMPNCSRRSPLPRRPPGGAGGSHACAPRRRTSASATGSSTCCARPRSEPPTCWLPHIVRPIRSAPRPTPTPPGSAPQPYARTTHPVRRIRTGTDHQRCLRRRHAPRLARRRREPSDRAHAENHCARSAHRVDGHRV